MSKKSEKKESKLVRKADDRAAVIRRVVQEYGELVQTTAPGHSAPPPARDEIERAVVRYNKAIKRLRKKIELKSKEPQPLVIRQPKYSRAK